MKLLLAGRRVVELGTMLAAPFAGHILSQLGAEVIKVEPPSGDPTRTLVRGGPGGTFIAYNHGKQSLCIDLGTTEGQAVFAKLLASADILVHNLSPHSTRRLRVTFDDCQRANPELVYCHIRGYGRGPLEDELASNPVAEAATGVMDANRVNGRPSRLGPSYHDQFAGAYAVIGILAALFRPAGRNVNRPVEIGLYETGLHVAARDLVGVQLKTHLFGRPEREPSGEFSMPGYGAFETSDGRWAYLLMLNDGHWAKFCQALSLPEAEDDTLTTLRQRRKRFEHVEGVVKSAVASLSFDALAARLGSIGFGFTEVLPAERVLESPQARQPGKLSHMEFGGIPFDVPDFPCSDGSDTGDSSFPPQRLGEQTIEILRSIGIPDAECQALLERGVVAVPKQTEALWAPVKPKREDSA